ncbi:hypothetical protein TrLO_g13513 [Triparma laevis f. longispina]|uniref:Uncharacterized protein n=1 Tax=Triparma laevis f. longispina TaxID=1714387 RepID=A0A9W7FSC8_9STRA|nr:hypothetical protein TrLO_g13513 [Triparma laevis f. longispina]
MGVGKRQAEARSTCTRKQGAPHANGPKKMRLVVILTANGIKYIIVMLGPTTTFITRSRSENPESTRPRSGDFNEKNPNKIPNANGGKINRDAYFQFDAVWVDVLSPSIVVISRLDIALDRHPFGTT